MSEKLNNIRKFWLIMLIFYLAAICWILPVYMQNGYYELGEAKAKCYWIISGVMLPLFIVTALILVKNRSSKLSLRREKPVSEVFLIAMVFSNMLSLLFAVDKKTAVLGIEGWRTGFITILLMLSYSLFFSWISMGKSKVIIIFALILPFLVFTLSILNRFGVYPVEIYGQNNSFLATIGNINWFSGYLAVFVPIGIGIMHSTKPFGKWFFLSGIYTLAGLMATMLQGSDGAVLFLIAVYGYLLWDAFGEDFRETFKKFLIQTGVLGLSIAICEVLLKIYGNSYTYDENILFNLCRNHAGVIIIAVSFFLYRLECFLDEVKVPFNAGLYRKILAVIAGISLIAAGVWAVLSFDDSFGNGRGIIWRMSFDMFMGLSPWQKMVGVGQNCFYPYALSDPMWSMSFENIFGSDILTNAHCEVLTLMIEEGLLGATVHVGLFTSVIYSLSRIKEKERIAVVYALPIISYFVFGLVSFSQVTSTPYAFLCIGMAIAFLKKVSG
jgi:hypothetical protein